MVHFNKRHFVLLVITLSFFTNFLIAGGDHCMLRPVSLQQRVASSQIILEGEVLNAESYWNVAHNMIYTSYQVQVFKMFKGSPVTEVTIVTPGGRVGNDMVTVTSNNVYGTGDQAVFFLQPTSMPANPGSVRTQLFEIYAGPQGSIDYDLDEKSAHSPFDNYQSIQSNLYSDLQAACGQVYSSVALNKRLNTPNNGNINIQAVPTITSFTPTSITAGTRSLLTINGTNFGAVRGTGFVEFKNANDGGGTYVQARPSDYRVWTNTQIQVWVPNVSLSGPSAGTGTIRVTNSDPNSVTSAGTLTILYSHISVDVGGLSIYTEHVNDNGSGGYTFQMESSTFATNAPAVASFMRAFDTWRCNTNVNWTVGANSAVNATVQDNINLIRFDVGAELPAGIGGRCLGYISFCAFVGADTVAKVTELDVIIDDGAAGLSWQYGPALATSTQYDFETVMVHELGHGMMLSHINLPGAVMHYSLSNGQNTRTLNAANDIAGGNYVMTKSFASHSCKLPAEAMTAADISGAINIAANPGNQICSGTSVTFTATSIVPAGTATYQWKKNGGNAGTGLTYVTSALVTGDIITCVMTVTGGCNEVITSNPITMSVNPVASVSISSSMNNYCYGPTINFTATPVNGGTAPSYQWKVNGLNVGTNSTGYSSNTLIHGDVVTCVMTSNAPCVSGSPATSNAITMQVWKVTVSVNPNDSVCQGQSVAFTATVTNGTPFSYTWFRNGFVVGGNTPVYNPGSGIFNGDIIYCQISTSIIFGCSVNSNQILMRVFPPVTPSISIGNITPSTVCAGATSQFTSSINNGGPSPEYDWIVDGAAAGTGSTLSIALSTGPHAIRCLLTSNAMCATSTTILSNQLTVTVNPLPVVSVSGSDTVCSGNSTALTLNSTIGGTTFFWTTTDYFANVTGEVNCPGSCGTAINQTLTNTTPTNGVISYNVTGGAAGCFSASVPYRVTVKPLPAAPTPATATPNSVCLGATVNLNANGVVQSPIGFSGSYSPASFTTVFTPSNVGGSASMTTDTIFITGPNIGIPGYLYHEVPVPASGTVSFLWQYSTADEAPGFDQPNYYINGIPTLLPGFNTGGAITQTGIATVSVTAGQNFGVGMYATDGCCGAGSLKVTLFNGPLPASINWFSNSPSSAFISTVASGANLAVTPTVSPTHEYRAFSIGNGCTATQFTPVIVTVNPVPVVTSTSPIICSGTSASINLTSSVGGSVFTWTTSAVSGITGNSNCAAACGASISQILTNTTTTGKAVNYTVIATAAGGCTGTKTATVQVQAPVAPPGSPTASPSAICLGQSVNLTATSTLQLIGFRFQNAPANWVTTFSSGSPGGSASSTSSELTMVSGDIGIGGYVQYSRGIIPATGTLKFKYNYSTFDNSNYDFPRLVIDGVEQDFSGFVYGTNAPQSQTVSVAVTAGQTFSFRMYTTDGIFGAATVVISEFELPVAGSIQWYSAAVGGTLLATTSSGANASVVPAVVSPYTAYAVATELNTGCINTTRVATNSVTVTGLPTISNASPANGAPGTPVTITGTNLANATSVTFNAVTTPIITNTNTQITVNVPAGATTGPLQVTTACGSSSLTFTVPASIVTLNLKVFLQGLYAGGQIMTPSLLNSGVGTNSGLADSITVYLRNATPPYAVVQTRIVAVQTNGQSSMTFPSSVNGQSYYLVVRHRNSLETWSKNPVTFATITTFNFTSP